MTSAARERTLACLACLGLLALSGAVPATLRAEGCTVETSGVGFGTYSGFNTTPTTTTGTIHYTCTLLASPPSIKLSRGQSATFTPRLMSTATDALEYDLYREAACTTVWGDGTSGTSVYAAPAPADGATHSLTIYGRIPAGQNVRAGTYVDAIVVTIEF